MTNEMFENLCLEFKEDTGYLAPDKDNPSAFYVSEEHRERVAEIVNVAWKAWLKGRERGLNYREALNQTEGK